MCFAEEIMKISPKLTFIYTLMCYFVNVLFISFIMYYCNICFKLGLCNRNIWMELRLCVEIKC